MSQFWSAFQDPFQQLLFLFYTGSFLLGTAYFLNAIRRDKSASLSARCEGLSPPMCWMGETLTFVCLVMAITKFVSGVTHAYELYTLDQTDYIWGGLWYRETGYIPLRTGMLYCYWFSVLSYLQSDPQKLYYLSFQVLAFSNIILFYFLLRRYRVKPAMALMASAMWMMSVSFLMVHRVHSFSSLLFLVFLHIAGIKSSRGYFWAILSLGSGVAFFNRPEFIISYVLCMGIFLSQVCKDIKSHQCYRGLWIWMLCLLCIVGPYIYYSYAAGPSYSSPVDTAHFTMAFGQHISDFIYKTDKSFDPWNQWVDVSVEKFFLSANASLSQKFESFQLMMKFGARNVFLTAKALPDYLVGNFGYFLPHEAARICRWAQRLFLLTWLGFAIIQYRRRGQADNLASSFSGQRIGLVSLVIALPILIACVLVYPRNHFFSPVFMMVYISLAFWAGHQLKPCSSFWKCYALPAILMLLWTPALYSKSAEYQKFSECKNKLLINGKLVKALRDLHLEGRIKVLSNTGLLALYVNRDWITCHYGEKSGRFDLFLKREGIDVVLYRPEDMLNSNLSQDLTFIDFLKEPKRYGFVEIKISDAYRRIFVRLKRLGGLPTETPDVFRDPAGL